MTTHPVPFPCMVQLRIKTNHKFENMFLEKKYTLNQKPPIEFERVVVKKTNKRWVTTAFKAVKPTC